MSSTKQYRPYTIVIVPFNEGGAISLQDQVNCVSFYNAGNTVAYVNAMPIQPQMGWTPFEANYNEVDISNYNVRFDTTGVATPQNSLLIIRKSYQSEQQ